MAGRIRTIKPELRELLAFASLSDGSARLFVMLYTLADDCGRCPASPSFLHGAVFFARPTKAPAIGRMIAELVAAKLVAIYEVNGAPFIEIAGWSEKSSAMHQRIEKPQPARYPAPSWFHSGNDSGTHSGTDLDLRPGPGPGPGPGEERSAVARAGDLFPPAPDGWMPPAGGAAEKTAQKRIDAGEIERADVAACAEKFYATVLKFNNAIHRDRMLASWITKQRRHRADHADENGHGRHEPDPDADYSGSFR